MSTIREKYIKDKIENLFYDSKNKCTLKIKCDNSEDFLIISSVLSNMKNVSWGCEVIGIPYFKDRNMFIYTDKSGENSVNVSYGWDDVFFAKTTAKLLII